VLEHERVELVGLDLAALLRLGGERVQCGNLDDAGLQVSSFVFRRATQTARAFVSCVLRSTPRAAADAVRLGALAIV